jgi:2'-5' RNA ligase
MMDTLRAFIALEMPPQVVDIVRQSQQALQRGGIHLRWVRPENVHLTLRFLGDISTDVIDGIRCALERLAVETPSFSLRAKGAGVFPGPSRPRVVWLGLDGQHHLQDIHGKLSSLLSEQGFPPGKRPFEGHLTIGRSKGRVDTDRLRGVMAELATIEGQFFPADRVCLFKSDLKPGGAVYTPLVQVRTGGIAG